MEKPGKETEETEVLYYGRTSVHACTIYIYTPVQDWKLTNLTNWTMGLNQLYTGLKRIF